MATLTTTRTPRLDGAGDPLGGGFAGSILVHAGVAALLLSWAWLAHSGQNWGDANATAGAVQATMVADIPLPPRQPMNPDNVLATDAPSPAPVPPAPPTVALPRPDDIPVPKLHSKPAKTADQTTPPPPLHPQPIKTDPNKAPSGEAPGVRIAMSSAQTQAGTVSVDVKDSAFGTRFAYYVRIINQQIANQWYTGMLDAQASGHRVYITFQVQRDGSLSQIKIAQPSGDPTLDQTALNAVRRIDNFGPLPDQYSGSYLNVTYYFDPSSHP